MSGYLDYLVGGQSGYTGQPTAIDTVNALRSYSTPVTTTPIATPTAAAPGGSSYDQFLTSIGINPATTGQWSSPTNAQIGDMINGGGVTAPGFMDQLGSFFKNNSFLGTRDQQGYGGLLIGGAQALGNLYLGMQQYNLAKESLAASKDQFAKNFAASRQTTNNAIENRYAAAVARGAPGSYQSVGDYMKTHGV